MNSPVSTIAIVFTCILIGSGCASSTPTVTQNDPAQTEETIVQQVTSESGITMAQVLARHVEARGGMENIKAIQSLMWDAQADMMGMQLPLSVYVKRPGKIRTEVFVPQMNAEIVTGYDGEIAWTTNPMAGGAAIELPANQAGNLADQADLDGLLIRFMNDPEAIQYDGNDTVMGNETHKFTVQREGKNPVVIHLDAETFLETRVEAEGVDPQTGSAVPTVMDMGEYKEVEGVLMAHKIDVAMNNQPFQKLTIKEIKANISINDQIFAKPSQ